MDGWVMHAYDGWMEREGWMKNEWLFGRVDACMDGEWKDYRWR